MSRVVEARDVEFATINIKPDKNRTNSVNANSKKKKEQDYRTFLEDVMFEYTSHHNSFLAHLDCMDTGLSKEFAHKAIYLFRSGLKFNEDLGVQFVKSGLNEVVQQCIKYEQEKGNEIPNQKEALEKVYETMFSQEFYLTRKLLLQNTNQTMSFYTFKSITVFFDKPHLIVNDARTPNVPCIQVCPGKKIRVRQQMPTASSLGITHNSDLTEDYLKFRSAVHNSKSYDAMYKYLYNRILTYNPQIVISGTGGTLTK